MIVTTIRNILKVFHGIILIPLDFARRKLKYSLISVTSRNDAGNHTKIVFLKHKLN